MPKRMAVSIVTGKAEDLRPRNQEFGEQVVVGANKMLRQLEQDFHEVISVTTETVMNGEVVMSITTAVYEATGGDA